MLGGLPGSAMVEADQMDEDEEEFDMEDLLDHLTANDASSDAMECLLFHGVLNFTDAQYSRNAH